MLETWPGCRKVSKVLRAMGVLMGWEVCHGPVMVAVEEVGMKVDEGMVGVMVGLWW
jgi:hypothetical protein